MKTVKANKEGIKEAVKILKSGGTVIYPTETSYGLGADATNKKAVKKVFAIKKRDPTKPMTIIVSSLKMAKEYADFNSLSLKLAKQYWPGALTLVLPLKKGLAKPIFAQVKGECKNLGVRLSPNPIALAIVKKLGAPLISTSANLSGDAPGYQIKDIISQFKDKSNKPDLIIDAGKLPKIDTSTVVKAGDKGVKILRQGPVVI